VKGSQRITELDALRGFAAIGVVLWHYSGHFDSRPWEAVFGPFYYQGLYLVDFFFVLSGFVLSKAYFRKSRQYNLAENIIRRAARIYPLHLFTFGLVFIGQFIMTRVLREPSFVYSFNDLYHFFLNLTLTQSLGIQKGLSFNGPSWSISTEFYVSIIFFIILATSKKPVLALISLLIVSGGLLTTLIMSGHMRFIEPSIFRTLAGFLAGVVLFKICSPTKILKTRWCDLAFLLLLFLLAAGAKYGSMNSYFTEFMLVILGFPLIIFTVLNGRDIPGFLRLKFFSFLGDISFSIYLIHFPIQLFFHIAKSAGLISPDFNQPVTLLVYFAVTIVLSGICYYYFEHPVQNLINTWWTKKYVVIDKKRAGICR